MAVSNAGGVQNNCYFGVDDWWSVINSFDR